MQKLYKHYFNAFRKLITDGWLIYNKRGSILYRWVYPCTSLPTKFSMREAYEITSAADASSFLYGTTRAVNHACCLLILPKEY